MTADKRAQGRIPIELWVAGGVMVLTALSIAGLALASAGGPGFEFTSSSVGPLVVALVFAAAGIEAVRRRHFLFAIVVPTVLALLNLGYVIGTRQWMALWSVAIWVVVAILVNSRRSDFRD